MSLLTLNTPVEELNHSALQIRMLEQLDSQKWNLEKSTEDVSVYSASLMEDGVDGFKTVTEHHSEPSLLINYLGRNICSAMQQMNHLYVSGETLKLFYDNGDEDYFAIVRTNFKMPFPLTNREFLHSLKVQRIDEKTVLIMYHSVIDDDLPPAKDGFLRSTTYLSGQRITLLANNMTRVEHMMVYHLRGNISKSIQNKFFKKGHLNAYIHEWQKLVDFFREKEITNE